MAVGRVGDLLLLDHLGKPVHSGWALAFRIRAGSQLAPGYEPRPAIAPVGEARPNTRIFRALAARMGYTEPCFADDDETLCRMAYGDRVDFDVLLDRGFATLRFNFRGVGRSQGSFDSGIGELSDAASALDWVQSIHPEAQSTWIAGYSFGALIGMQLLMRRPEVRGFISVAPPANMYDFSFLAPCPASGIFVQGAADTVVQPGAVAKLVDKLRTQKHITIHHEEIPRANHFFENEIEDLRASIDKYLDFRLDPS